MSLNYITPEQTPSPIHFMTQQQMYAEKGNELLFDIECYPNFFLIGFKSYVTGLVKFFTESQEEEIHRADLQWLVTNCTLIGFNSTNYDCPMLFAALAGKNVGQLYEISRELTAQSFNDRPQAWRVAKKFGFVVGGHDTVDVQTVAPALPQKLSLKHYGARMHTERLQELPVDFRQDLSFHQMQQIKIYNINDLDTTGWLRHALTSDLELRKVMNGMYGIDLRSRSDAQIAERVMKSEIKTQTGIDVQIPKIPAGTKFFFNNPDYVQFYSEKLQQLHQQILNTEFVIDENGKVTIEGGKPKWSIKINETTYTVGIGGLHSTEKSQTYFTDKNQILFDRDVASYYPNIILNQSLFPQHIGPAFLEVYREIVERRLKAKAEGDKPTSESLKITINGGFGKLGNKWSIFYSPDLLIQVTVTGQLSLLMLIEMMEWYGIPVVSANTDGIVMRCPREKKDTYLKVIRDWERITDFVTEETRYASIHSRDVNNYIAITNKGEIKAKGAYTNKLSFKNPAREALMTNPNAEIVTEAVMLYLKSCKSKKIVTVDETITKCRDLTKFLFVRRVNGGAVCNGQYIGKVVRWYWGEKQYGDIRNYKPNKKGIRTTVSETDGAKPVMDLPEKFPKDVNYSKYIQRAKNVLADLGYGSQLELF